MAATSTPIREYISKLMLLDKSLSGSHRWSSTGRTGQCRSKFPVSLEGEITQLEFVIDTYPRERGQWFTFTLNYGSCIMRCDHDMQAAHRNSKVKHVEMPHGIEVGMLNRPHLHSWADNCVLGTANSLPDELKFARPIPTQVHGFENAFRWFCGLAKISFLESQLPSYPTTDVLI